MKFPMRLRCTLKNKKKKARNEAAKKAQVIIANAINQYANETVNEKRYRLLPTK